MFAARFATFSCCLTLVLLLSKTPALQASTLTLQETPSGPHDIAIAGEVEGIPAGEKRWLKWSDLRALPTEEHVIEGEFVPGPQKVTVAFLSTLLDNLPVKSKAPTVLAYCKDGYLSVFDPAFVATWRPVIVLEINGQGPEAWPPPGLNYNPGPTVITVEERLTPGVNAVLDIDHKRPWGVNEIHIVSAESAFKNMHSDKWAALSQRAQDGRTLWVNSCMSCHVGPGEKLGGTKSGRPFAVLAAHAEFNAEYFKNYVRAPQKMNPGAKMAAHPHYTDEQLLALIAFITGEQP